MNKSLVFLLCLFVFPLHSYANSGFDIVALGVNGGISDGNLTAFFISPKGDNRGVMCDAGTLVQGAQVAVEKGNFNHIITSSESNDAIVGNIIKKHIKGYLISHAHLDHLAGLVIVSPDDVKKEIYAFPSVLSDIQDTYFNWRAWPNFGSSGVKPILNKYSYRPLTTNKTTPMNNTSMTVTAYPLSHSGVESTAFLIEHDNDALLCLGDTGDDDIEKSQQLERLWLAVSERVKSKNLTGIIIESSYTNAQPKQALFGHLTPQLVNKNLTHLAELMGGQYPLSGMKVLVSHIKYSLNDGEKVKDLINEELNGENHQQVHFIIPQQGDHISFE
jgi:3',5'-cyclic-nucleotide phosphodiesterase